MRIGAALVVVVALSGCVHQRQAQFVESEFAPYAGKGTSGVAGQAFMKTLAGDVKYGAGNEVGLVPVTSYTSEWFDNVILAGRNLSPGDARVRDYIKTARGDGQGNFRFDQVPSGDYFVVCRIVWMYPTSYGLQETGGWAFGKTHVNAGEMASVVVTR